MGKPVNPLVQDRIRKPAQNISLVRMGAMSSNPWTARWPNLTRTCTRAVDTQAKYFSIRGDAGKDQTRQEAF